MPDTQTLEHPSSLSADNIQDNESEEDLQALLGIDDDIDHRITTPQLLLQDVITNPGRYHPALRPHIAGLLIRSGLEEEVSAHQDLFQNQVVDIHHEDAATSLQKDIPDSEQPTGTENGQLDDNQDEEDDFEDEDIYEPDHGVDGEDNEVIHDSEMEEPNHYHEMDDNDEEDDFLLETVEDDNDNWDDDDWDPYTDGPLPDVNEDLSLVPDHYPFNNHDLLDVEEDLKIYDLPNHDGRYTADETKVLVDFLSPKQIAVFINKFESLPSEIAYNIINSGYPGVVLGHHETFPNLKLDREFAKLLFSKGYFEPVLDDIDTFTDVAADADLAREIFFDTESALASNIICKYIDKFSGLDRDIAEKLIRNCTNYHGFNNILLHLDRFNIQADDSLARMFMEQSGDEENSIRIYKIESLLRNLGVFSGLSADIAEDLLSADAETAEDLMRVGPSWVTKIRNNLFRFHGFSEQQLEKISALTNEKLREFPGGTNRAEQYRWYADFAYQNMGIGWRKTTIGQIIALRIEQVPGENNLHDASQWLSEFRIPEKGYDASRIEALRSTHSDWTPEQILEATEVTYKDPALEEALLIKLCTVPSELRSRLNIPSKGPKLDMLFTHPAERYIYSLIAENLHDNSLFNDDGTALNALAKTKFDAFFEQYEAAGAGKGAHDSTQLQRDELWGIIDELAYHVFNYQGNWWLPQSYNFRRYHTDDYLDHEDRVINNLGLNTHITGIISQLQQYGRNRQAYIDDTQGWLLRHATAPNKHLTKAWGDRPMALANGVKDSLSSVLTWQQENSFRFIVNGMNDNLLPKDITKDELLGDRWTTWRNELLRVMSANNAISAIVRAKRWMAEAGGQQKVVPAMVIKLKEAEPDSKSYHFEILAADDPRGFTIGEDTGCCMTINGVSESCIKEGYINPNAGFLAFYDTDGRLAAQSFFYVNPSSPDTVVLDNIETNKGRDLRKLIDLYKKGWQEYISKHTELSLRNVHIGEGYTDADIWHLPSVIPIPPLNNKVYTDAERQRKLI